VTVRLPSYHQKWLITLPLPKIAEPDRLFRTCGTQAVNAHIALRLSQLSLKTSHKHRQLLRLKATLENRELHALAASEEPCATRSRTVSLSISYAITQKKM
jgi:hypothetical protein